MENSQSHENQQGAASLEKNKLVEPKANLSDDRSVALGWITVNTSDSAEANRMNLMKGNPSFFSNSEQH